MGIIYEKANQKNRKMVLYTLFSDNISPIIPFRFKDGTLVDDVLSSVFDENSMGNVITSDKRSSAIGLICDRIDADAFVISGPLSLIFGDDLIKNVIRNIARMVTETYSSIEFNYPYYMPLYAEKAEISALLNPNLLPAPITVDYIENAPDLVIKTMSMVDVVGDYTPVAIKHSNGSTILTALDTIAHDGATYYIIPTSFVVEEIIQNEINMMVSIFEQLPIDTGAGPMALSLDDEDAPSVDPKAQMAIELYKKMFHIDDAKYGSETE